MADTFFSQIDEKTLRELLARTGLRDAAVITVSSTLYIENSNEVATRLTGLHPLERIDQLLSVQAVAALRDCIAARAPHTVYEELDGLEYRLEILPHRDGALLAFVRDDRVSYDGTLRVLHAKGTQYLGTLLADAAQVDDPTLAAHLRRQCLRLHRLLMHSDFLHDPPLTEQLQLHHDDLAQLCRSAAEQASTHASSNAAPITVHADDSCIALIEPQLIRTALYNLLANALHVTPPDGDISLSLYDDGAFFTITVADRGPGLDAARFEALLSGWQMPAPLDEYLALARQGTPPGLGLPLIQRIAQLHGGSLLLSPREGGGSQLHFTLAHLPESLADHNLHAPMILEDGYPLEEIEFSVLD